MPIAPHDENILQDDADVKKDMKLVPVEGEKVKREGETKMPDAPGGLMVFYTQKEVILTWDEVRDQDVERYKVYRSSGDGDEYVFVGDAAAPAFTDREVKPDTKYYYRVTSVGVLESQPSKEIVIVTEVR